jgi:NADH-quinone oxidoreductase subunit M
MPVNQSHLLSVILFTPLVGAILLLLLPRSQDNMHRVIGNVFGILGFVVSLPLVWRFQFGTAGYQFRESYDWIPSIGAHY